MEVLKLIEAQREYFNSNKTKEVAFRIAQLKQLYSAIKKNEALLEDAIYKDFKKSKFDTYTTELGLLYIDIKQNIKNIKKWSAIKKVKTNIANFPGKSYMFSQSRTHKQKILTEISFGGGAVNDAMMHIANPNFPFGGVGDSGIGSYHGEDGFKTFSHYKSILEKVTSFETPLKYYPHTAQKLKWAKRIMGKLS